MRTLRDGDICGAQQLLLRYLQVKSSGRKAGDGEDGEEERKPAVSTGGEDVSEYGRGKDEQEKSDEEDKEKDREGEPASQQVDHPIH